MNFRNRYLVIAVRILLGLIMLASGVSGLLMGNSTKGVPPQMVAFTQVFWASGIFQMVKVTEIVAGFALWFSLLTGGLCSHDRWQCHHAACDTGYPISAQPGWRNWQTQRT